MELTGCVIIQDGKILLLHRASKDWYELPGGKIEKQTFRYHWFRAQMKTNSIMLGEKVHDHLRFILLKELETVKLSPNIENLKEEIEKGTIKIHPNISV